MGSGLSFGGWQHATLCSRQKMQAKLGQCGSFTLQLKLGDVQVLDLDLDFVGLGAGASTTGSTGLNGSAFSPILTVVVSGNFRRPMEVKGRPLRSRAYFFFSSFVSSLLSFGLEGSWMGNTGGG